ncbi:MAG: ribulose-phosphate 3-epimerase [Candidatus Micrarchaeota archaeon]
MDLEVIPAILVKSREELVRRIELVKPYVRTVQIDVMDGKFVRNTTVTDFSDLPRKVNYEFHWMVENPGDYIREVPGKHMHMVHIETVSDWKEMEKVNEQAGGKLGLAFNPETQLARVTPYLDKVSRFLVMTVNPGFDKQKYLPEMEEKMHALRKLDPTIDIEVDGGINLETIGRAASAGANKFDVASAIFGSGNIGKTIKDLEAIAKKCSDEAFKDV